MNLRNALIRGASILLALAFLFYAATEARGLFIGPTIILNSPPEGISTTTPLILLSGQSLRTKELTANGDKVFIDTSGYFSEHLVLSPGYNIMTIVATDARGKRHTLVRHLIYDAPHERRDLTAIASTTTPDVATSSPATTTEAI
jgi:hypothetical protein